MNARTSRLIKRVAFVSWLNAPAPAKGMGKQPLQSVERGLKQAWTRTPRPQRAITRKGLVAIFNELAKGRTA